MAEWIGDCSTCEFTMLIVDTRYFKYRCLLCWERMLVCDDILCTYILGWNAQVYHLSLIVFLSNFNVYLLKVSRTDQRPWLHSSRRNVECWKILWFYFCCSFLFCSSFFLFLFRCYVILWFAVYFVECVRVQSAMVFIIFIIINIESARLSAERKVSTL